MLVDTLSRAPLASVDILEVLKIGLDDVTSGYEYEKFCGAVFKCMKGEEISDSVVKRKIEKLLPLFHLEEGELFYEGKLFVPRKAISTVLQLALDAKTFGHFGYLKKHSRLRNHHSKHKSSDFKIYVRGFLFCARKRYCVGMKLTDPNSLEFPISVGVHLLVISWFILQIKRMAKTVSQHMSADRLEESSYLRP